MTNQTEETFTIDTGHLAVRHLQVDEPIGRCLLVPPFGLAAGAMTPVAQTLAAAGFDVVTLDPRDHVGHGSGTIADYRISTVAEDVLTAIDHFEPTCVVAVSLGARAAIRALAQAGPAPAAVLLTPVVDVRATICEVLEYDLFAMSQSTRPAVVPVLGSNVNSPGFLHDCEDNDMVGADATIRDLRNVGGPVTLIPGSDDPWVDAATVRTVAERTAQPVNVNTVESHLHAFHEDAELAIRLIGATIDAVVAAHQPVAVH